MLNQKPGTLVICNYRNHGKWIGQIVEPTTTKTGRLWSQAEYCEKANRTIVHYPFGQMADCDDDLVVISEETANQLRAEYWRGPEGETN